MLLACSELQHLFHFSAPRPASHATSVLLNSNHRSLFLLLKDLFVIMCVDNEVQYTSQASPHLKVAQ